MGTRVTELRCKEVINITDGLRLGFVSDVEVQLPEGKVLALVVPGPCRFFRLFGRKDDFVIPWQTQVVLSAIGTQKPGCFPVPARSYGIPQFFLNCT